MKTLQRDEIFKNLTAFLSRKGVDLKEGSYASTIQKSCQILTDVINLGQQGVNQARQGIDQNLDKLRQTIHEKTAPKPPRKSSTAKSAAGKAAATPPPTAENPASAPAATAAPGAEPKAGYKSNPLPKVKRVKVGPKGVAKSAGKAAGKSSKP